MRKITSFFVLAAFLLSCAMPPQGFAQSLSAVALMSEPGIQVALGPAFTPAHLKGMVINATNPFKFDFIINRGDEILSSEQKQEEYKKLVKYFLASLAVPDTDQWVNLSPYEKDRLIPDNFGMTEMGRDLLAQDYMLKQISSSLTNPDTDLGRKFWDGVYALAHDKFGTTNIPTDTFNKVWIIPDKAVVYEKGNAVYILEHHLKVMLESDYKAMKENAVDISIIEDSGAVQISKQVMREVIVPAIEKEVNEGKNFAPLRQVYSGMLLATWYKMALKESILGKHYVDRSKVKGVDQDPKNNQEIYGQYVQAFKKGVFNMIKEDVDRYTQEIIPRKYFSGGTQHMQPGTLVVKDGDFDPNPVIEDNLARELKEGAYDSAEVNLENEGAQRADLRKRKFNFDSNIKTLTEMLKRLFTPKGLEYYLEKSGLGNDQIRLLKDKGAGILTVNEFLDRRKDIIKDGGISIGLSGDLYKGISEASGLSSWDSVYLKLWGDFEEKTDEFMEHITSSNKPVVFFIPADLLTHRERGITKKEFEWLLKDEAKLKNVYFVFGLYDLSDLVAGETENRTIKQVFHEYDAIVKESGGAFMDDDHERFALSRIKLGERLTWHYKDGMNLADNMGGMSKADEFIGAFWSAMSKVLALSLKTPEEYSQYVSSNKISSIEGLALSILYTNHGRLKSWKTEERGEAVAAIDWLEKYYIDRGDIVTGRDVVRIEPVLVKTEKGEGAVVVAKKVPDKYELMLSEGQFCEKASYKNTRAMIENMGGMPAADAFLAALWEAIEKVRTRVFDNPFAYERYAYSEDRPEIEALALSLFYTNDGREKQWVEERRADAVKAMDWLIEYYRKRGDVVTFDLKVSFDTENRQVLEQNKSGDGVALNVKGGIDLARSNLDLHIKRDNQGVPLPVNQQDFDNIRIDGLVPVVLNIQPAGKIPLFGGSKTISVTHT